MAKLNQWLVLSFVAVLAACGGSDEEEKSTVGKTCQTNPDCGDGAVCLGPAMTCALVCTGDIDACGAHASCGGVGVLSVDVCQTQETTSEDNPPEADEQPRIPCSSDAECQAMQAGTICAQWQGVRDCTLPCATESQCDMPAMPGMKIDFLTCIADEGQTSRKACLPDSVCFTNILACVQFDGMTEFDVELKR